MKFKQMLREEMRKQRQDYQKKQSSDDISQQWMQLVLSNDLIPEGSVVAGYWPSKSELDIRPLLVHLAKMGYSCTLPVAHDLRSPLQFREWQPGYLMISDLYDILVPDKTYPLKTPSILIVPVLAFDLKGHRLGQGAGYYDRTLAFLRANGHITAIGAAFDFQEVDQVPREDHDQPLDLIVTPKRVIRVKE